MSNAWAEVDAWKAAHKVKGRQGGGPVLYTNGTTSVPVANLRMKADRLICNGQGEEGRLLHLLLDNATADERMKGLEEELDDAKEEARDAEKELEESREHASGARDLLRAFMRAHRDSLTGEQATTLEAVEDRLGDAL
jgi:hypothetical protein